MYWMRSGLATLAMVVAAGGASLTLDPAQEFQTIDGFGGFGGKSVNWSPPIWDDAWGNLMIRDWGLTITRQEYYPGDGKYDCDNSMIMESNRRLKAIADAAGEPLKFICTFWSPKGSWKSNGSATDGGSLNADRYDDFGAFASGVIDEYKAAGIDLYAMSLQNEPEFVEFYNSCVYTAEQYRDLIKIAGGIVKRDHPNVKLYGPETMLEAGNAYISKTTADAVAKPLLNVLAYHGYSDGVNPTSTSKAANCWRQAGGLATTALKIPVWMTETSGFPDGWDGAMQLEEAIYTGLKYGKMAGWVFWYQCSEIVNTPKYPATKQFYRYVRPGAVMIGCTEDDPYVHGVAFNHKANKTLTMVILNSGSGQATVNLTGTATPSSYKRYLSTASEACVDKGTITSTSVTLPARSITTLVAQNYNPPTVHTTRPQAVAASRVPLSGEVALYGIDGRAAVSGAALRSPGCYIAAGQMAGDARMKVTGIGSAR